MIDLKIKQYTADAFGRISAETIAALKEITPSELVRHGIIDTAPNFSERNQTGYICPLCESGTGRNHGGRGTGAGTFDADNMFYCHACNNTSQGGHKISTIDLFRLARNIGDFKEACTEMAREFNINIRYDSDTPAAKTRKQTSSDDDFFSAQMFYIQADLDEAPKHLDELPESQRRGLTLETMRHFKFGFIKEWVSPKTRAEIKTGRYVDKDGKPKNPPPPTRRIIIPAGIHYNAVALSDDRANIPKDYWKMHTCNISLFNADALLRAEPVIIAVEGEIDVASIWQASGGTVDAVGVTGGNANYLINALESRNITGKKIVILFDKDDGGQKNAEILRGKLIAMGVPVVNKTFDDVVSDEDKEIIGGKIDANSILVKLGAQKLREYTESILTAAQVDFKDVEGKIARDAAINQKLDEWQEQNGKIYPETLGKLKIALDVLNSLTPENITAAFAKSDENITNVALATAFGFYDEAEKFFIAIKAAKEIAKNRMKEADALTAKLTQDELVSLSALVEGVNIKSLRNSAEREAKSIYRTHVVLWRAQLGEIEAEKEEQEYQKRREAAIAAEEQKKTRMQQLREMEPSEERDKEIITLIRDCCEWRKDKHGAPYAIKATQKNADLMFNFDPVLDGLFAYNEFTSNINFLKTPLWNSDVKKGDQWKDEDDAQLRTYLRGTYTEFANEKLIRDNVVTYSQARRFHEIREYFKALPKWDGKPRAETIFIDWLRVADTSYAREVTLNWLTAAVARVFNPGCNFQKVVVLTGNQGLGKDFIFERLGGKWHSAIVDSVDSSHAIDALQISWLVVFEEMYAVTRADINAVKSFISRREDVRRFAYDRRARRVPRQCVFAITTNSDKFLRDITGNRRYLILECQGEEQNHVKEVRGELLTDDDVIKQIWAEVYARYNELFKDGFDMKKLELSDEAKLQAAEFAEKHADDQGGAAGEIKAYLDKKIPRDVIWDLLTKEERRKFFVDDKFEIDEIDLHKRFENSGRITAARREAYQDATIPGIGCRHYDIKGKHGDVIKTIFVFYGTEYRQHICTAEIINECFDKTKRLSSAVIHEILKRLDGWHLGKRIGHDPAYGNQANAYYRDADNIPRDDDDETTATLMTDSEPPATSATETDDFYQGATIDDDDLPL